jgi:mono/diheme cytochrome c family protein
VTLNSTRAIPNLAATLTLLASLFASDGARAGNKEDYLAMTGAELYTHFCVSCHGSGGRGDGPAAKSSSVKVPDLTLIASREGGKFPSDRVGKIIDGRYVIGAHGTRDMPIWGEQFMHSELGNPDAERATEHLVAKLMEHVRSLQRPAPAPPVKKN